MFNNSQNEMNFMAEDANIYSKIEPKADHIAIQIDGYSETASKFVNEYFSKMKSFEADQKLFAQLKETELTRLKNLLYDEPNARLKNYIWEGLHGTTMESDDKMIKELNNMSFEDF